MPKALHIAMDEDGMLTVALSNSLRFSQPRYWFRETPGQKLGHGRIAVLAFPVLQNAIRQLPNGTDSGNGSGITVKRFTVEGQPA
jgi:hypothetical protein